MEIIINKDVTKYKIERWKGLSLRQVIIGTIMLISVVCGILFFFLICKVPLLISSIMISPVALGMILFEFYEPDGMKFWIYLKKRWNRKVLLYRSIWDEEQEDTSIAQMNRLQRFCTSAKKRYNQVATSKLGIYMIRVLVLGRAAIIDVYLLSKRLVRLIETVIKKLKQIRSKQKDIENDHKKAGEESE